MSMLKRNNPHKVKGITFTEPSRTKQADEPTTNLNTILAKYNVSKADFLRMNDSAVASFSPDVFADVSNLPDYAGALELMDAATEQFMALPSDVRLRFKNSPINLISFLKEDKNREEAIKLGLVRPPEPPPLPPVPPPDGGGQKTGQ